MSYSLIDNLRGWRSDRRITVGSTQVYVANVIEELLEIYHEDKQMIKDLQKEIMGIYFGYKYPLSETSTIDAIQDIQVFSINETELMGYNAKDCHNEVFKEINSRQQDPIQNKEWSLGIYLGGKWQKDINQDKDTLYTADYNSCRLNS